MRGSHDQTCERVALVPPVCVLIVANDKERARALKQVFDRHGHTVYIALRNQERYRFVREHPPGIVVITAARLDAPVERALAEIKRDRSARVLLVCTAYALGRTLIKLLRRTATGYLETSSITLAEDSARHSVWTWIVAASSTLYLAPGSRRRRPAHRHRDA